MEPRVESSILTLKSILLDTTWHWTEGGRFVEGSNELPLDMFRPLCLRLLWVSWDTILTVLIFLKTYVGRFYPHYETGSFVVCPGGICKLESGQELTNFFNKEPASKYFGHWSHNYSTTMVMKTALGTLSKWVWLCSQVTVDTETWIYFHIIPFISSQPFKYLKWFLACGVYQTGSQRYLAYRLWSRWLYSKLECFRRTSVFLLIVTEIKIKGFF